ETIPWSRLRPLDGAKFGTQKLRPRANDAVLSYLQFPNTPEYLQEAAIMIGEVTGDRQLIARVDHTDQKDGTMFVTLFLDAVNADIVGEGLAMVPRKPKPWERAGADVLAALKKREELAKEEKRGMWEYGDFSED
ncbi:hypothetical protein LTR28_011589, partial [Elasticomyces elasticus]